MATLETNDIQHFLLARTPALAARYEFLTFRSAAAGRTWLSGLIDKVGTASSVGSHSPDARWVTLAFTWNGLRALGLDDTSLNSFPDEFKQGMAARAEILGITGTNHPQHWLGNLANSDLHAIAILFARDVPERERCHAEHTRYLNEIGGVNVLSSLDLEAIQPFLYPKEHFGYRDRLSHPLIEGVDPDTSCGWEKPTKSGEFFIGYVDESGYIPVAPQPDILSRNGSYIAYIRLEEHVGAFRDFLRLNAKTPEEQELVAAKLMGRWRSGAPLTLCPEKDDPELGADPKRTNDFDYGKMDPHGYGCPVGSHMRRMNPRDTAESMERHKMIRRGGTYGPALPEGAPDDGIERGIAAFVGCASLVRQFEFAMNVWTNDPNFKELGNERDPFVGTQDGTYDFTIPKRPIKRKIKGLPAFTTIRGGAYFFLPGIRALRYLSSDSQTRNALQNEGELQWHN